MSALPFLRRRRERHLLQRRRLQGRLTNSLLVIGLSMALALGLLIVGGALAYASITTDLPSLDLLTELLDPVTGSLLQPTRIYDRTGTHLLALLAAQDGPREYVSINPKAAEHLPDVLMRATVALTDPNFWNHPGCEFRGLTGENDDPGLAQKLATDILLWDELPGLRRNIRSCILAVQITSRFGHERILEWYLNTADYGRFSYGAGAASQLYLGKSVTELNMAEAALLASVARSPAINPLDAPQVAVQRGKDALDVILARGLATVEEINSAQIYSLKFQPAERLSGAAPAFTSLALSQLENRFNRARIERGGMLVITTLDYDLQKKAECALQTQLLRLNGSPSPSCEGASILPALPPSSNMTRASASAVVLDPRSGEILVLLGDSTPGTQSAFLTPHRPATLLTPFVYLAGFTRGLSPASLVWDIPFSAGEISSLNNAGPIPMRIRTALVNDRLAPAAQVFEQMGPNLVHQTMLPFGLDISADEFNVLIESDNRFSVLQMAQSYAVFAAQGTLFGQRTQHAIEPWAVIEVRGMDGTSYGNGGEPASEQIVSPQLSYLVNDMLSSNIPSLGRPVAFWRGFISEAAGTWAVGYTPYRVAVTWMDGEGISQRPVEGVWSAIMSSASLRLPPYGWPQPPGVIRVKVCDSSGMLPTAACPGTVEEVFIEGNQPVQADTLYRSYAVNSETGFLATIFTPSYLVEDRIFMLVPPAVQALAGNANLSAPPVQYDTLQAPPANPDVNVSAPQSFAEINGRLSIKGTAAGSDFLYYRLEYGQGLNPEKWILIGSNTTTPVKEDILADWDTSGLRGLYSLQLLVVRKNGTLETAAAQVIINNP